MVVEESGDKKVAVQKLLVTEEECSQMTSIPRATLKTRRSRPTPDSIPFVKSGKSVLYPVAAIKRWIESKTRK